MLPASSMVHQSPTFVVATSDKKLQEIQFGMPISNYSLTAVPRELHIAKTDYQENCIVVKYKDNDNTVQLLTSIANTKSVIQGTKKRRSTFYLSFIFKNTKIFI